MFKLWKTSSRPEETVADVNQRLIAGERVIVLDVRQPGEYREGHVAGSVSIPLDQLSHRLKELPRDRHIAAICRSGNRSSVATDLLLRAGFQHVANVKGGMLAWHHLGLPVEHGA